MIAFVLLTKGTTMVAGDVGAANRRTGASLSLLGTFWAETDCVCAQRGLVLSTLVCWRRQAKLRDVVKPVTPFLQIALGPVGAISVVKVELRSRTRLRFECEAALRAVAHLVAHVK